MIVNKLAKGESFNTQYHVNQNFCCMYRYYFDGRNCSVKDFYDPAFMDFLIVELEGYMQTTFDIAPGSRLWLGETAGAWGGGAEGISDRYAGGFL